MLIYGKFKGLRFFDANDGGSSGGGTAAVTSATTTAATVETPFDKLPMDEFDEETRKTLTQAKQTYVATLQNSDKLKTDLEKTTETAKQFQSTADRATAELQRLQKLAGPADDPYLVKAKDALRQSGYQPADIEKMAPTFALMLKGGAETVKGEIAKELAPYAQMSLAQEARTAFEEAQQNDPLGMLTDPAVSQKVWEAVTERATKNQGTTRDIVLNIAKMAWADHLASQHAAGKPIDIKPVASMKTGMTFPGGANGRSTIVSPPLDPNAPKTQLNEDTQAALRSTFKTMGGELGLYPPGYEPPVKKARA